MSISVNSLREEETYGTVLDFYCFGVIIGSFAQGVHHLINPILFYIILSSTTVRGLKDLILFCVLLICLLANLNT